MKQFSPQSINKWEVRSDKDAYFLQILTRFHRHRERQLKQNEDCKENESVDGKVVKNCKSEKESNEEFSPDKILQP